jgi:hypothetical protein
MHDYMPDEFNARAAEAEALRRQSMTGKILGMMGAALLAFTIPIVWGTLSGSFALEDTLFIVLVDVPVLICWW